MRCQIRVISIITKLWLTKISIFVLIPKVEVLFDHLMPMKMAGMTGAANKVIWGRENMLTALSFTVSSPLDICWMSLQLAKVVMCMTMECTYHKLKAIRLHKLLEGITFKGCWKGAANVVSTTNVFSKPTDKVIDDSKRVLCTRLTWEI